MKYKNYVDDVYYVLSNSYLIVCFVLSMLIIILHVNNVFLIMGIIALLLTITFTYLFYDRSYYLKDKILTVKIGFFHKNYSYKDIKKAYITENNKLSYATSTRRLCIEFKNKTIYISPEKMDEVLLNLIKKPKRRKKW